MAVEAVGGGASGCVNCDECLKVKTVFFARMFDIDKCALVGTAEYIYTGTRRSSPFATQNLRDKAAEALSSELLRRRVGRKSSF